MFEARLKNPMVLVNPIRAIYELVKDDISIHLSDEGLIMRAMDPANVAMIIFKLKKSAFEKYELKSETYIGVNMERLFRILKRSKSNVPLDIKIEDGKMTLVYGTKSIRRFTTPLLSLESGPRPEPSLKFTANFEIDPRELKQAIEDSEIISDAVVFIANPDELMLVAQGDFGSVETIMKEGDGILKIDVEENAKSKYSLEYLKKMMKGLKVGGNAKLMLKTDFPMKLEFKGEEAELSFILAPRIDVE
ncbi:MAG: proliferating cell nuclear antigen (pcna) [Candidatus Altiarchaeota archaeon]|nr:proliferating cell nuclear antigen (pcna) [Candidatus Altiarchaeota archaeon]